MLLSLTRSRISGTTNRVWLGLFKNITYSFKIDEPLTKKRRNCSCSHYQIATVRKTRFSLALVEGTTVGVYLNPTVLAAWWLAGHFTPIVLWSCETQTTRASLLLHSGHLFESPTLTLNLIPFATFSLQEPSRLFSF